MSPNMLCLLGLLALFAPAACSAKDTAGYRLDQMHRWPRWRAGESLMNKKNDGSMDHGKHVPTNCTDSSVRNATCIGKCNFDSTSDDYAICASSSCEDNFGLSDAKANCNAQGSNTLCPLVYCVPYNATCPTDGSVHCLGSVSCSPNSRDNGASHI